MISPVRLPVARMLLTLSPPHVTHIQINVQKRNIRPTFIMRYPMEVCLVWLIDTGGFAFLRRTKRFIHGWRSYILGGKLISDYLCICFPHSAAFLCVDILSMNPCDVIVFAHSHSLRSVFARAWNICLVTLLCLLLNFHARVLDESMFKKGILVGTISSQPPRFDSHRGSCMLLHVISHPAFLLNLSWRESVTYSTVHSLWDWWILAENSHETLFIFTFFSMKIKMCFPLNSLYDFKFWIYVTWILSVCVCVCVFRSSEIQSAAFWRSHSV